MLQLSDRADLSVGDRLAPRLLPRSGINGHDVPDGRSARTTWIQRPIGFLITEWTCQACFGRVRRRSVLCNQLAT